MLAAESWDSMSISIHALLAESDKTGYVSLPEHS